MSSEIKQYRTTAEVCKQIGIHPSRLNRAYLAKKLPEPARLGRQRILGPEDVAEIRRVLEATKGKG